MNSRQVKMKTARGDYLVQASWPLCWTPNGKPKTQVKDGDIPIMYHCSPFPLHLKFYSHEDAITAVLADLTICV